MYAYRDGAHAPASRIITRNSHEPRLALAIKYLISVTHTPRVCARERHACEGIIPPRYVRIRVLYRDHGYIYVRAHGL